MLYNLLKKAHLWEIQEKSYGWKVDNTEEP